MYRYYLQKILHESTRLILIINIIYKKHTDFQDCRVGIPLWWRQKSIDFNFEMP